MNKSTWDPNKQKQKRKKKPSVTSAGGGTGNIGEQSGGVRYIFFNKKKSDEGARTGANTRTEKKEKKKHTDACWKRRERES